MRQFKYFESQEGGMEEYDYSFNDNEQEYNFGLFGWMSEKYGCDTDDKQLVEWAKKCEVGEFYNHRMGTFVRVKTLN